VDSTAFLPLRQRCVKMLNKLANRCSNTFINSIPLSMEMIRGQYFKKVSSNGPSSNTMDFEIILKVPKNTLKTKAYQETVVKYTLELILENLATYSYSIAFPDLAFPVTVFLRNLLNIFETSLLIKRLIVQLLEPIEQNIQYIHRKRETSDTAPKDIRSMNTFHSAELRNKERSPLSVYLERTSKEAQKFQEVLRARRAGLNFSDFSGGDADADGGVMADGDDEENANEKEGEKQNGKGKENGKEKVKGGQVGKKGNGKHTNEKGGEKNENKTKGKKGTAVEKGVSKMFTNKQAPSEVEDMDLQKFLGD